MRISKLSKVQTSFPGLVRTFLSPCLTVILFLNSSIWASQTGELETRPHSLTPGVLHKEDFRAGQSVAYRFPTIANTSYLLKIDQGGLDLVVAVRPADGETHLYDSPLFRDENELILHDAVSTGEAVLTLSSDEYTGAPGLISVLVTELTPKSEKERMYLAAMRQQSRATMANHRGNTEGWNEALEAYDEANSFLYSIGDNRNQARNLYSSAWVEYWQMLNWDRAIELAARAAQLYTEVDQPRWSANAIHLQAASIIEKANEVEKSAAGGLAKEAKVLFDEALLLFRQALATQQLLGFEYDAAKIINNIGLTYYYMGAWDTAIPYFQQAAEMYRAADEWEAELDPLANLAVIDFEKGRLVKAIESFKRTLEILPTGQSMRYQADTLDNLAASQLALGQLDNALRSFSEALVLHRQIDDLKGQGRSLTGIGVTYYSIGEQELALEYLVTALGATRKANDGRGQVSVLNFIGNIKRQRGDFGGALEAHSEAQTLVTSPMDKANGQLLVGQDLIAAGRPGEALEILARAKSSAAAGNHQKVLAGASLIAGDAWLQTGQYEQSLESYEKAADAYQSMGLGAEQAQATFGSAKAMRALGDLDDAAEKAQKAITSVEGLRSQLIDPELRAFFLASRQEYYAFLIDTLMYLHDQAPGQSADYLSKALSVSERSRARALIDLISEASVRFADTAATAPDDRQSRLYQQMAEYRYQLNQLLENPGEEGTDPAQDMARIQQDLAAIENELNLLQIEYHRQNPAYASLTNPQILEATQIQSQLDDETALLQYALGDERSYVWLVTRNSIAGRQLPGRDAIEQYARAVYEQLQAPTYSTQARTDLSASLTRLSEQILKPVGQIQQARIIIVADGVLQYLPFSILGSPGKNNQENPLLENHEIIHLPSMSVLATQRQHRRVSQSPPKEIAIFADPVFSSSDSRLAVNARGSNPEPGAGNLPQAISGPETVPLSRLPATAQEAMNIASLVEPARLLVATGFDASRKSVVNTNLSEFRVIHFATHGLIDSRYPALSALAFSQLDKHGQPQDGYLRLHDIYNLELNADLVALSACSTALGREISGEGLTGLTQGLMYSGSRSVLASLWQVPDRATAELMKRFYQNLLEKKQKPATALRNAQLELATQPRWQSPYFWSAFVLQGEWL